MRRRLFRDIRFSWAGLLLFLFMAVLLALGYASIRSACAVREGAVHDLYLLQLRRWIPAGLAAYVLLALLPYQKLVDFSVLPYTATIVLLILVLIPGLGTERFHARRWLFGFQPSEIAKLAVLLVTAFLLTATTLEKGSGKLAAVAIAMAASCVGVGILKDIAEFTQSTSLLMVVCLSGLGLSCHRMRKK